MVRRNQRHATHLRRTYGLSAEQYWALYDAQGGACALCLRAKGTGRRLLSVDHDHKTGLARGLLCTPCNKLLGHARDDRSFFERTITYLTRPPAFDVIGEHHVPTP